MGLLTSRIVVPALLVLTGLAGCYAVAIIAGMYYPCSLPALTAHQARHQVGHFMRTAGVNQKALNLIAGLQRMGATAEIIDRLSDNCRDCILRTESIGPLQSIWVASLIFPSRGGQTARGHPDWLMGTQHADIQIGSCRAVWIERSLFEPPDFQGSPSSR